MTPGTSYFIRRRHGYSRTWLRPIYGNNSPIDQGDKIEYKVPSRRGDRSIVAHVESAKNGLLDGCLLLFTGRKRATPDYHTEMNQDVFLSGIRHSVFTALQRPG